MSFAWRPASIARTEHVQTRSQLRAYFGWVGQPLLEDMHRYGCSRALASFTYPCAPYSSSYMIRFQGCHIYRFFCNHTDFLAAFHTEFCMYRCTDFWKWYRLYRFFRNLQNFKQIFREILQISYRFLTKNGDTDYKDFWKAKYRFKCGNTVRF